MPLVLTLEAVSCMRSDRKEQFGIDSPLPHKGLVGIMLLWLMFGCYFPY